MLKKFYKDKKFFYQKKFCQIIFSKKEYITPEFEAFLNQLDHHIKNADVLIKNSSGDTTTVARIQWNQNCLIVKRYNFRNFFHALKLQFRKNYAERSFYYASLLEAKGVPTITPIAIIKRKFGFIKGTSYFISKYQAGMPGCSYFCDNSIMKAGWSETINGILNLIAILKIHKIFHGDFHFGNLIITNKRPLLLDFDSTKIISNPKKFQKFHGRDLKNFYKYLAKNQQAYTEFKARTIDQFFLEATSSLDSDNNNLQH